MIKGSIAHIELQSQPNTVCTGIDRRSASVDHLHARGYSHMRAIYGNEHSGHSHDHRRYYHKHQHQCDKA